MLPAPTLRSISGYLTFVKTTWMCALLSSFCRTDHVTLVHTQYCVTASVTNTTVFAVVADMLRRSSRAAMPHCAALIA